MANTSRTKAKPAELATVDGAPNTDETDLAKSGHDEASMNKYLTEGKKSGDKSDKDLADAAVGICIWAISNKPYRQTKAKEFANRLITSVRTAQIARYKAWLKKYAALKCDKNYVFNEIETTLKVIRKEFDDNYQKFIDDRNAIHPCDYESEKTRAKSDPDPLVFADTLLKKFEKLEKDGKLKGKYKIRYRLLRAHLTAFKDAVADKEVDYIDVDSAQPPEQSKEQEQPAMAEAA